MAAGASGWVAQAQGITCAAAGTARTILSVTPAASKSIKLTEVGVGFIGNSGTAKPVKVELVQSDGTGAGSGSSGVTINKADRTQADTVQSSAASGYATTEPTTLSVIRTWRVHPQATFVLQFPLNREPRSDKLLGLRVTFETGETITTADAYLEFEE